MRTDQLLLFNTGIPVSQALSAIMVIVSAVILITNEVRFRKKKNIKA